MSQFLNLRLHHEEYFVQQHPVNNRKKRYTNEMQKMV